MSPSLALSVWAAGVLGLFYLDRERGAKPSKALWLPTLWLLINGSRPVSLWLGLAPANPTPQQVMDGSPIDATVLGALLAISLVVLLRRRARFAPLLRACWPLWAYLGYCLVSVLWSPYAEVALKRWTKSLGDLAIVLIVATELDLAAALRRLVSRVGILLLPASIVLVKYFPALGRSYDAWSGNPMNNGVATNKNMLGVIAFLITLGAFWQVLVLLKRSGLQYRGRRLLAQLTLTGFGVWTLAVAHSATSIASALLGGALLAALSLPALRRPRPAHAVVALILFTGVAAFLLGAEGDVVRGLGRRKTLTGRTDIWAAVLQQAAKHPVLGVGFESFWLGKNAAEVWALMPTGEDVNEAHDGYIEVYAQLGLVGLGMVCLLLLNAYRQAVAALGGDPSLGRLLVGLVAALLIYNITEAGFRMLDPAWIFLLLAVICAARIVSQARSAPLGSPAAQARATEVPA